MMPLNDKLFTSLPHNKDILFFEVTSNAILRVFASSITKEDNVVLVSMKTKSPKNTKDFEDFKKKMIDEDKTIILVEDI